MAKKRSPTATQVNGVSFIVKDPDASSGDFFNKYRRVPGLASFTLPDETGSSNEVQLQDGTVATAQAAGVGQITGTIGALTSHATHRFLSKKAKEGGNVTISIVRPAIEVVAETTSDANNAVTASTAGVLTATGSVKETFKNQLKEGMIIAVGSAPGGGFTAYDATLAANTDKNFRVVSSLNEDGGKVQLEVGFSAAVTGTTAKFIIRRPGQVWKDISCTVAGFGDGDYQSGGVVQGTITLQPATALPVAGVEYSLISDFSNTFLDGVFADIS